MGEEIKPSPRSSLAEIGSLTMEFTRLTQLTGDPKYYDAVQRIMNELEIGQDKTRLPGMWPTWINTDKMGFDDSEFTIGGCADSAYEYFPKAHILLGAQTDQYRRMYEKAIQTFNENLLFRAMTKDEDQHILFAANIIAMRGNAKTFQYSPDHLKCFMGGTVAIGAKVFNRPEDMYVAKGLTDGCVWAYDVMPTGIMPEVFKVSPCRQHDDCPWDEEQWYEDVLSRSIDNEEIRERAADQIEAHRLPPGVTDIRDASYNLRYDLWSSSYFCPNLHTDIYIQTRGTRICFHHVSDYWRQDTSGYCVAHVPEH
jgi:mannosyl-oligosaccharide alpha-1,2-mannosidase